MIKIIFILGFLFLIANGIFFFKVSSKKQFDRKELSIFNQEKESLLSSINALKEEYTKLLEDNNEKTQKLKDKYEEEKSQIKNGLTEYKKNTVSALENYQSILNQTYSAIEEEYDKKISLLEEEKDRAEAGLLNIQNSLNAGIQAQLREQEKKQKENFYKINISEEEMEDILSLNKIKKSFHQPVVLNKLIWSAFIQKKVTEMCNRILGTGVVCGIYKITNLKTQQVYIGQSLNISDRWKQHCKCGCGIDAAASNKLYQDMIKTGVWNYSFELMEACDRSSLNEKERLWINLYQSNLYGLNSNQGIRK